MNSDPAYIALDLVDIAVAALLIGVHGALSLLLRLNIGRHLIVSAVRMVVQLGLLAIILESLFSLRDPLLTAAAATVMILFAGYEVTARQTRRFEGWWTYGIGAGSMMMAGVLITLFALTTQVRPDPWYDPRYALVLLGMILGNTMNGVSLGLDRLLTSASRERPAIEARLALGHPRNDAMREVAREAVRGGLIPIINTMAAAGVVSIPGMMTGQILGGVPPVEAAKYQILIIFLIAGGTGLGVITAVIAGARRLTDERHRLRLDRLEPQRRK
ncbi:MAG: ABC transporter permease [Rhodospirillales bacterium]|nr:ABC transporter permease [Rhodospirillales bacterium]MCW9003534.1 ABC transporter permease [Rhodospirillales bacterium]